MCPGECIPLTRCQEYSLQHAQTFLPWIISGTGNIIPCENPIGRAVILTNMSAKLFARNIHHSDGTLSTQICMREMVQQLIDQCLTLIDERDVLYNTMACRRLGQYYLYYRSKLIIPSSVFVFESVTSESNSFLISQASTLVYKTSQGILFTI